MNKKPLLITVNNHVASFEAVTDRMEFEKFSGEVVRTFTESDTIEVVKKAGGFDRICIIVTDSLVASEHTTDSNRSAGTESMIKQLKEINPACKVIVYTTDFWGLEKVFTDKEVDFIDAVKVTSFDIVCKKILQYSKAG